MYIYYILRYYNFYLIIIPYLCDIFWLLKGQLIFVSTDITVLLDYKLGHQYKSDLNIGTHSQLTINRVK